MAEMQAKAEKVEVPRRVYEGIEQLGPEEADAEQAASRAKRNGDYAAYLWLERNDDLYARGVSEGFAPVDEEPYAEAVRKELEAIAEWFEAAGAGAASAERKLDEADERVADASDDAEERETALAGQKQAEAAVTSAEREHFFAEIALMGAHERAEQVTA